MAVALIKARRLDFPEGKMKKLILIATALISSSVFAHHMSSFDEAMADNGMFAQFVAAYQAENAANDPTTKANDALVAEQTKEKIAYEAAQSDAKIADYKAFAGVDRSYKIAEKTAEYQDQIAIESQDQQTYMKDPTILKYRKELLTEDAKAALFLGKVDNSVKEQDAVIDAKATVKKEQLKADSDVAAAMFEKCYGKDGKIGGELLTELQGGISTSKLASECRDPSKGGFLDFDSKLAETQTQIMNAGFAKALSN
jgi:hypothetical protein